MIDSELEGGLKENTTNFLRRNIDVFAWTHNDIEGIDLKVMSHKLNIHLG